MVDSKFENRDNFVISNKYDDEEAGELDREDYDGGHSTNFSKKYVNPFTIGGVGLIAIVILLVIFLSGSEEVIDDGQLASLETRIQQLEKQLVSLGPVDQALDRLGKLEQKLNQISERSDRFNSTVTTQIDQIIKELGMLHQKSSRTPQAAITDQKETKVKFHEVRPQETLWGISRQYGLTVDQLSSYNDIGPEATLQPGQRLRVTPN